MVVGTGANERAGGRVGYVVCIGDLQEGQIFLSFHAHCHVNCFSLVHYCVSSFCFDSGPCKIPLHFESSEFVEFWLLECHRKCLGCLEYFAVVGAEMYKAVDGSRIAVNAVNNVQNIIYYVTSAMRRSA